MVCAICATAPGRKTNPRQAWPHTRAFTLIEMLVAMAITLVMMGAVVTLFANLSNSVRNRRATTEMSGQLRHVRNVLQQDLQGATCPGVTWQRPESNHGYIEIIEGPHKEGYASDLIDADPFATPNPLHWPPSVTEPEIDHKLSTLPSSNLPFKDPTWATDGGGLGDDDDILMLTVRNEHEPFTGRAPSNVRNATDAFKFSVNTPGVWDYESIQSPLAEVVWFSIENPGYVDDVLTDPDPTKNHFFGEPGFRTIYRRTLLIAPWLNPYRYSQGGTVKDTFTMPDGGTFKAQPGLMRILPKSIALDQAIAAVVAFQDRYDLSVRLEWDGDMDIPNGGRWKIVANTLGDLTKRENRFQHFGYRPMPTPGNIKPIGREYPFAFISAGYPAAGGNVGFATDPDIAAPTTPATATALGSSSGLTFKVTAAGAGYVVRPFAFINVDAVSMGTARAMLNDEGSVVRVLSGPVPLWGSRRGEDVMITNALAFDLRVYDPGAPVFATWKDRTNQSLGLDVVVTPSDPGWRGLPPDGAGGAYLDNVDHMHANGLGKVGTNNTNFQYVGQGAYVDMGYGYDKDFRVDFGTQPPPGVPAFPMPVYADTYKSSVDPWFFRARNINDVYGTPLTTGYCVYDTWSFHYENNGINEDGFYYDTQWNWYDPVAKVWKTKTPIEPWRSAVDQGVDGVDNDGFLGVDDVHERETRPAYDVPLRGIQVLIRSYEHDSRAIRQVRVNQHFMQE